MSSTNFNASFPYVAFSYPVVQYKGCVGWVAKPHSSSLQCPLMITPSMYPVYDYKKGTRELGYKRGGGRKGERGGD